MKGTEAAVNLQNTALPNNQELLYTTWLHNVLLDESVLVPKTNYTEIVIPESLYWDHFTEVSKQNIVTRMLNVSTRNGGKF